MRKVKNSYFWLTRDFWKQSPWPNGSRGVLVFEGLWPERQKHPESPFGSSETFLFKSPRLMSNNTFFPTVFSLEELFRVSIFLSRDLFRLNKRPSKGLLIKKSLWNGSISRLRKMKKALQGKKNRQEGKKKEIKSTKITSFARSTFGFPFSNKIWTICSCPWPAAR